MMTRQNLLQADWVLIDPPYLPDIAPLDVHLFWSLQNFLMEDCKSAQEIVSCSKREKVLGRWIIKLPQKWQKVAEQTVNVVKYVV